MRRLLLLPLAVAVLLLAAPAAWGGGWATVGLSSTPDGLDAGTPWKVDITIMQHGVTPLSGLEPALTIRAGDTVRTVAARPTGKTGVYRAEVVFPRAGRWQYEVRDGFVNETHTFAPVEIAPAGAGAGTATRAQADAVPAPADDDGRVAWGWLAGAAAALIAAAGVLLFDRRRRRPGTLPGGAAEPA
jgi:hypothetical protein